MFVRRQLESVEASTISMLWRWTHTKCLYCEQPHRELTFHGNAVDATQQILPIFADWTLQLSSARPMAPLPLDPRAMLNHVQPTQVSQPHTVYPEIPPHSGAALSVNHNSRERVPTKQDGFWWNKFAHYAREKSCVYAFAICNLTQTTHDMPHISSM